ncbi:MAG TPA: NYN domain-containing protein [Rubrobacteraceae bacterium]|jgi:predicted RNA-binding protein with PIN domain|nr:NYN domain-containing protein [Rubrobacteraceae bacterium]
MTAYLILDGYNVIGAIERYRAGSLDESRELLVNDALKAAGWTGREIIVVFDAHRGSEPERVELRAGGAVRLIYSAPGESADDVMERLLGNLDGAATIYTADFALQRTALARGVSRATPREFAELLDELPAVTRSPAGPRRSRISDRLSPETLRKLEEIRRRVE